ncbi:hypothetical protein GAMM_10103 [Gammaproteobacteria bacterium]
MLSNEAFKDIDNGFYNISLCKNMFSVLYTNRKACTHISRVARRHG